MVHLINFFQIELNMFIAPILPDCSAQSVIVGVQGKLGFVCGPQYLGKARWYAHCPSLCGSIKRMALLGPHASLGALGSWFSLSMKTEWGSSSWFPQNYNHPFILSQHKIEVKFNKLFCYNTGGGAILRHQLRSPWPSLLTKGAPGPSDAGTAATSRSLSHCVSVKKLTVPKCHRGLLPPSLAASTQPVLEEDIERQIRVTYALLFLSSPTSLTAEALVLEQTHVVDPFSP